MSEQWPTEMGNIKTQDDSMPRSHEELFRAVHQHAEAIVHLTEDVPSDCKPVDAVPSVDGARWFLTVAYRWGYTNDHHYFVYTGPDQVKAMTLADAEVQQRGGKYGCVVYAFDANGVDYQLMYYAPSMTETDKAKAPVHNHRLDFHRTLGQLFEDACDGKCWLPDEETGKLEEVAIGMPECLKLERTRQRELMRRMKDAEQYSIDKTKTPPPQ